MLRGMAATCWAMPSCPLLHPRLLALVKSCPPWSPWGRKRMPGPWWCWDWLMVVLGLVWGGAGGWPVFWSTALSLALCMSGDAHAKCGERPCADSGLTPCSAMTPPREVQMCPLGAFQPFPVLFSIRML